MRWSILVVLALQAAMCGQKGPLYLPDHTLHAATAATHEMRAVPEPHAVGQRS